ncbi:recombinase family protein [Sphingomicrobium arenosum]|uniref:recombinase family protein n=1 Tax=Sphingomicrobium arenosum TaxID=2233861 RepID=UPI002240F5C6|nr:recombinase family protein [Sphingomicrobium arenosum]
MKRCAIYTRKSSEEGLDQQFNSLDAQREACEAYALSQAGEGWRVLPDRYNDGGFSGGNMERPGLQRLLGDIASGKVDVVIVYKIDRLTRSLPDFARIVERFDQKEVSFVSVTQAFNTTTSMGRLTLNVLLSFAQFEREVTGERIRDKIAASKAKGMWMGGVPPLGYDPPLDSERVLRVNDTEAETVRLIFDRYLEIGSVQKLKAELDARGIRPKQRTSKRGNLIGGDRFSRTALFHLLKNPIYIGKIVHKDELFKGRHRSIVDGKIFSAAQKMLASKAQQRKRRTKQASPLAGKLFLADGKRLSPTHSVGASGRRYKYYAVIGEPAAASGPKRVSASSIERFVMGATSRAGISATDPFSVIRKVILHRDRTDIFLPAELRPAVLQCLGQHECVVDENETLLRWSIPTCWSAKANIRAAGHPSPQPDVNLVEALRKANAWLHYDAQGRPMIKALPAGRYDRRILRLAFLAPDIQQAILDGTQSPKLTLEALIRTAPPLEWGAQRKMLAEL